MLGRTNTGGGGGGLNFQVIGGTTAPSNPKENTIWINTDVKITSWIFSATEPATPEEGMVWITIGTASNTEFNALKKNGIQVYPLSAKQYVSGAWVDVTAKSYQNGEWVDWVTWLYDSGTYFKYLTGDWKQFYSSYNGATVTHNANNIYIAKAAAGNYVGGFSNNLDLSKYKKLCCEAKATGSGNYSVTMIVTSASSMSSSTAYVIAEKGFTMNNTVHTTKLDISSLNSGYIAFRLLGGGSSDPAYLTIYKIWLE